MKRVTAIACLLLLPFYAAHAEEQSCDMLFVQDGQGMAFDGTRLTLKQSNPNIIFFCDRPERIAGHMTRDAFMQLVTEGENSFKENPPNAAVSVFSESGDVAEVIVTLSQKPESKGEDMVFEVTVLDGKLPATGDNTVIFIDPIGRPMSPTSIRGVHRRHVRRAVRHEVRRD